MEQRTLCEPCISTEERTLFTIGTNDHNRTVNVRTSKFRFRCMIFVLILSILTNTVLSVFFVWTMGLIPSMDSIFGKRPGADDNGFRQQWSCSNPMDDTHICTPCAVLNRGYVLFKSLQRHLKKETVDYSNMKTHTLCCIRHSKHLMELLKVMGIAKLTSSSKSARRGRTYVSLMLRGERNKNGNMRLKEDSVNGYSTSFKNDTITIQSNGFYLVSFLITMKADNLSEQKPITLEITKQGHRQTHYDRLLKHQTTMYPTKKEAFRSMSLQETFYFSRITRLHFDINTSNMTYDYEFCNTVSLALLPHDIESSIWGK